MTFFAKMFLCLTVKLGPTLYRKVNCISFYARCGALPPPGLRFWKSLDLGNRSSQLLVLMGN